MLGFFKKKLKKDARVAVCSDENAIAIARIRREKDLPQSLDLCEIQEIENISIRDAELARLTKHHDLDQYECISSLELGDYNLLLVEAPDVQPEELRAAIRWRVKDLIDFHIDDAVVDVFEVPAHKAAGKNKMMYAVVAKANQVKHLIDQLNNAGLNLDIIDIPELALRNIASMLPEDVGGVALVYVGPHQGLITITRQSSLYLSRTINVGTSILPESVLSVMDDESCQHWLDSIIIEVQRSMDYYESHFSQAQVSALLLTPIGKEIPGVTEYISEQLQIPARIIDVNELIDVPEKIDPDLQSKCLLAIGTALRQEAVTL
ncbi:MAG: pilus assembly protein PilM [Proteobacteria bacterium]|nr:pilus assembly protein PilM [Pseudomonadota bacterium]